MADKQILVTGSADAPAGYVVPNTVDLIPKAVSCILDGTGASSDFVPVLEVISDGGVVVAQSPGSTVTAGGSVEQSWFPRVGATAQAVAGSGVPFMTYQTLSATVTGVNTPAYMDGQTFSPDVSGVMAKASTVIGGNTYHGVSQLAAGMYLVMAAAQGSGTTTGDLVEFAPASGGGTALSGWIQGNDEFRTVDLGALGNIASYVSYLSEVDSPPTTAEIFALTNHSSANGHAVATVAYFYLGAGTLT